MSELPQQQPGGDERPDGPGAGSPGAGEADAGEAGPRDTGAEEAGTGESGSGSGPGSGTGTAAAPRAADAETDQVPGGAAGAGGGPAPAEEGVEDAVPEEYARAGRAGQQPQHAPHGQHGQHGQHGPPGHAGHPGPAGHRMPVPPAPPEPPAWVRAARPQSLPAPMRAATGWAVLATGLLCALLLGEGAGINLLLVAAPAALAAHFAAQAAGRRPRNWTLAWAVAGLALLTVPALRDATWPSLLAVLAALSLGSLALHGSGDTWRGAVLGSLGVVGMTLSGLRWGWRGVRERAAGSRTRWWPVVRTAGIAVALLVVFGALFAGADAAFAGLLAGLTPELSVADGPLRLFCLLLGLAGALAAARTAAAPWRWDRIETAPGRPRGRMEWALPLVVLNVLFAAFNAVQLTVLFGGYDKVLSETGLTYAEYARQGFWQLLLATLLTLAVIGLALRWAPRGRKSDGRLVRGVLGTLCLLTLVVVVSALRRMDLYVDAYGLTRLRLSVAAAELWLGVVIVLIAVAGARGALSSPGRAGRRLPRAVTVSAALGILAFGLLSPDGLIADQNVQRYERTGKIDLDYLGGLSADAVPALDRLPEPLRSCALREIEVGLSTDREEPWYATSWGEHRARDVLDARPVRPIPRGCAPARPY